MPLFTTQLSAAGPNIDFSRSNKRTFVDTSRRNSGRRLFWHSAESSPHTALKGSHSVRISYIGPSGMSSSTPGGSFGRVLGLHGKGSEGSFGRGVEEELEEEEEEEEEEEAMFGAESGNKSFV